MSTKNGSLKVCYVFCKARAREREQELTLSVCVCLALGYVRVAVVVVVVRLDLAFCRKCHWQNERTGRTGNPGSYTLFSINACYLAPATHTASCMCVCECVCEAGIWLCIAFLIFLVLRVFF